MGLHRAVGVGFGVAVSVGAVVGVGMLRTPSLIAGHVPDVFLIAALWVIGGMNAMLDANVLAELAVLTPRAGGPYIYARRALGDLGGLIVGWADWLNITSGVAVVSIGCIEFATILAPQLNAHVTVAALLLQLAFYSINLLGLRQGAWTQNITSLIKMAFLFFVVVAIFMSVPHATAKPATVVLSFGGIVLGYQLVVGAYSGWNAPTYFAEEKTDPARQLPRALFTGVALVAVLYVLFNLALSRALPLSALGATALPAAAAMGSLFGSAAASLVAAVAILCALSSLNAGMMMAPRILFGLSRDKLFLGQGTRINRGGTPYATLLVTAAFSLGIAATGTFETVFLLVGIFTVLVNVLMTVSFFVLRFRAGALERGYRARGYPWLPTVALTLDSALLLAFIAVNPRGAVYGAGLMLALVPIWLLLKQRRRKAAR